jgi:hypothetical protein
MVKRLLRPVVSPFLSRIRLIVREEAGASEPKPVSEAKDGPKRDDLIFMESISFLETDYYKNIDNIALSGFKVYSQDDEDGILQWIITRIDNPVKTFIEFGVQNYVQSNTRYLHLKDGYSGLIIEGDAEYVEAIRNDTRLKNNLLVENRFITVDNINEIINKHGFRNQEIGVLSIDIDGNDYWIWEAIDSVSPQIVICEYNTAFGYEKAMTIPYKKDFRWDNTAYFGASLAALEMLAAEKGYTLIHANQCNAFFIRSDCAGQFVPKTVKELENKYFWWKPEHLYTHGDKPLYDIRSDKAVTVADFLYKGQHK